MYIYESADIVDIFHDQITDYENLPVFAQISQMKKPYWLMVPMYCTVLLSFTKMRIQQHCPCIPELHRAHV